VWFDVKQKLRVKSRRMYLRVFELGTSTQVHRIGQDKEVTIYQLLCKDTVEQRIFQRAAQKLGLNELVLRDDTEVLVRLSRALRTHAHTHTHIHTYTKGMHVHVRTRTRAVRTRAE